MLHRLPSPTGDIAVLIGRVLLGVILLAHGLQKLGNGIGATATGFEKMGVPLPTVSALYATVVEVVGGALLIFGAGTVIVSLLVVLDMIGAAVFVHISKGIFAASGGWELVGVIAAAALVLAGTGAGRYSIDQALVARRSKASA
ncbi:DoxX family protein [Pseudonocardia eucalypti]|uniref:DoxX family protein n=1 Tax=Pseudonocardia eucalypti TaxID=648755 RepID=A0ABP9PUY6_9PSEU|nr:putative oxidoreductase [Pseudonocardia eucalypti]